MNKKLMILTLGLALAPMSVSAFFGSLVTKAGYVIPGVEGFVSKKAYEAFIIAKSSADSLIAAAKPGLEKVAEVAVEAVTTAAVEATPAVTTVAGEIAAPVINAARFYLPGSTTGLTEEAYTLAMAQLEKATAEKAAVKAAELALRPMQAAGAATVAGAAAATAGADAVLSKSAVAPLSSAFYDLAEQTPKFIESSAPFYDLQEQAQAYVPASSLWSKVVAHKLAVGGTLAVAALAGCYCFDVNPVRGLVRGWNNMIDRKIQRRLAAQQPVLS